MKFIQLLSTIASLAIFATAPGVSAAGIRAGVDKGEDNSGRRKLYRKHRYGPHAPRGVPTGVPVDFNNHSESQYYNRKYNNGHGGGYYEGGGEDYAYPRYRSYQAYEYGGPSRGHSRGHGVGCGNGEDADTFCSQFQDEGECSRFDHCTCNWDDSRGCHHY